jgi:hypothetical protein
MRAPAGLLTILLLASAGCAPPVDLAVNLHVQDVSTGWFDAGIVNGQAKLVPAITFTLTNASTQTLGVLQVNAVFKRVNETDEWGTGFMTVAGSEGVAPGVTTKPLTIRSQLGYTGSDQSRDEMLKNSHFVDAQVELSAKYGSAQWKRIGGYPIARLLLAK